MAILPNNYWPSLSGLHRSHQPKPGSLEAHWLKYPNIKDLRSIKGLDNKSQRAVFGSLTDRPQLSVAMAFRGYGKQVFSQTLGHGVSTRGGPFEFQVGRTLTNHAPKLKSKECPQSRQYNVNLGVLQTTNFSMTRSGRSDTPKKLLELMGASATAWYHRHRDASKPFEMAIVSALDRSKFKRAFSHENELKSLEKIAASIKILFPSSASVQVITIEGPNGDPVQITVKPPLLLNVVLSSMARVPGTILEARRYNGKSALRIGHQLAQKWQTIPEYREIGKRLGEVESIKGLQKLLHEFTQSGALNGLPKEQQWALEGLSLVTQQKLTNGDTLTGTADPGLEFLYLLKLIEEMGFYPAVQCKSGLDRTLTMVSLALASRVIEPWSHRHGPHRHEAFKQAFTNIANEFGPSVFMTNRSEPRAKWSSPVPLAFISDKIPLKFFWS